MRICIVVPMYNEEAVANLNTKTILDYARRLPVLVTVVVVNDGSRDATENILEGLADQYNENELRVISHSKNKGYGAAIKTGIHFAVENNYNYVLFMDSDLTNHPRYLADFYKKMDEGWDYIKATRYVKNGGMAGVPWKRRIISRCGNILARMITGLPLSDITNGFRAVKVEILKRLVLNENNFSIIIEELTKARKFTNNFCEIPHILGARSEEAGAPKFMYNFTTFWEYLRYLLL